VTDFLIATSGPSSTYPQRAYRNPTDALVKFLDSKHGDSWSIWEFRAEGTGYPDSEVHGRIQHFPWPDHHPPPFAVIPAIMANMKNWLSGGNLVGGQDHVNDYDNTNTDGEGTSVTTETQTTAIRRKNRVAVVHCKAGKGRSGTIACSYLVSQEGWKVDDALKRFTERRMRVGFGNGVSILSQVRWVGYVDRWANDMDRAYVERPVEVLEIHVWGLRDGVKIAVRGYVDGGKTIKCFHLFHRSERTIVDSGKGNNGNGNGNGNSNINGVRKPRDKLERESQVDGSTLNHEVSTPSSEESSSLVYASVSGLETVTTPSQSGDMSSPQAHGTVAAIVLRPSKPVILPTSDVNIDFERRTKAGYTRLAMATSIAHVWFNAYFEGGDKHDSGVFECEWEDFDGIRGSSQKGTKALERVKVVWRYPSYSTKE
jgi:protein-tyrosine phosphatase